jgi:O-methyltransferase involved in polyketide biosynthesis
VNSLPDFDLKGVSTTTLWTLNERAAEAARPDSAFTDPVAIELHSKIDYDWAKFGKPSQPAGVRSAVFDSVIRRFLEDHPGAPVVALGEGLQTTYWRVADPDVIWYSIDLQPVVDIREALLPAADNLRHIACSALDRSWMEEVPTGRPAFISVEGLLMYFSFDEVRDLLRDLAAAFPGGQLAMDSIPRWYSNRTLKGAELTPGYNTPPMPVHFTVPTLRKFCADIPGIVDVQELMPVMGRKGYGSPVAHALAKLPVVRDLRPSMALLTFA